MKEQNPAGVPNQKCSSSNHASRQRRFDMPMGAKPAAKVLRPSGNLRIVGPTAVDEPQLEPSSSAPKIGEKEETALPLMGSILERPRQSSKTKSSKQQGGTETDRIRSSRFAKSRETGFPTTKDIPLGSLVLSAESSADPQQTTEPQNKSTSHFSREQQSSGDVRQTIAQDAEAMLADMSLAEIQESVQELQSALNPSMIAFLKERGKNKNTSSTCANQKSNAKDHNPNNGTQTSERLQKKSFSTEEKARWSQILSSIKTFDDLDAAYEAYQQDFSEKQDDNGSSKNPFGKVPILGREDDFGIACGLLRSTSPHQTLWASRVVCRHLQHRVQVHGSTWRLVPHTESTRQPHWPFPTLLPVSLRCLLDANISHGNGGTMLQTTYVLQSLLALLQLRACSDHVVDITGMDESNESVCYQLNVLDDAVPSPSLKSCYAATPVQPVTPAEAKTVSSSSEVAGAAYSTSASPTTAQADADAFLRDPMWTLLSRMRILPRISTLLQRGNNATAVDSAAQNHGCFLPKEALIAICGILAMIGQRSPGAASAIVQHNSLLDDLTSLCWIKRGDSQRFEPSLALATIRLMCTLARQSRVAAEGLEKRMLESFFFLEVLSLKQIGNLNDYRLQQWTLILWRTFLRYGLGFSALPTILTLAAPSLTLGARPGAFKDQHLSNMYSDPLLFDLSPEFYSSFAVVLHCIQALNKSSTKNAGPQLSAELASIIASAGVWMSTAKQQAIRRLQGFCEVVPTLQDCNVLRSANGVCRFLSNLFDATNEDKNLKSSGEFNGERTTLVDEELCIDALDQLLQTKFMEGVLSSIFPLVTSASSEKVPEGRAVTAKFESCATSFLDSFISVIVSLDRRFKTLANTHAEPSAEKARMLAGKLKEMLTAKCNSVVGMRYSCCGTARRHWLNRVQVSIACFLNESRDFESKDSKTMKELVYSVIGRLQLGEERYAVMLFGYDKLMWPSDRSAFTEKPSPISTVLVRELCRTSRALHQLDHSFRLSGGLGVTHDGNGAFGLQSLQSEAENIEPSCDALEHLLPVGDVWLWQMLSGSVLTPHGTGQESAFDGEPCAVLVTALRIINELESFDDFNSYANRLNTGAKLYHVVIMCFHPEVILSNNEITELASGIIDKYVQRLEPADISVFGEVCRRHAAETKTADKTEDAATPLSAAEEAKLKSILEPVTPKDCGFTSGTVRSIEALFNDLCDLFLDFGAQFPFFTKCIRLFLANGFPAKIRTLVIQRLRGALHLLTLPDDEDLLALLPSFFAGGLPSVDNSTRDTPEILDCIASVYSRGSVIRSDDHFFTSWAVGMLARSFASSLADGGAATVTKQRILNIDGSIFLRIIETTARLLSGNGTLDDLVLATLNRASETDAQVPVDFSNLLVEDRSACWEQTIEILLSLTQYSH